MTFLVCVGGMWDWTSGVSQVMTGSQCAAVIRTDLAKLLVSGCLAELRVSSMVESVSQAPVRENPP